MAVTAPIKQFFSWSKEKLRGGSSNTPEKEKVLEDNLYNADMIVLPLEIIELIMKKLKVNELKQCRLVCKTWNKEACHLLQNRITCPMKFGKNPAYLSQILLLRYRSRSLPPDVVTVVKDFYLQFSHHNAPQVRFYLSKDAELVSGVTRMTISVGPLSTFYECDDLVWVIKSCGASLTYLEIPDLSVEFIAANPAVEDIFFPHLQTLNVVVMSPLPEESQCVVVDFLQRIAKNSPNLNNLEVRGCCLTFRETFGRARASLQLFTVPQIQVLETEARSLIFQGILNQNQLLPRLETLILHCDCDSRLDVQIFCKIRHFAPHLRVLELRDFYSSWEDNSKEDFTIFPRLKCLVTPRAVLNLGDTWLGKMPALKELHIQTLNLCLPNWNLAQQLPVCGTVTKLCVDRIVLRSRSTIQSMAAFHRMFPNVRKWKLTCSCKPILEFAASQEGQVNGFTIEELECHIKYFYPVGNMKGLERLILHSPFFSEEELKERAENLRQDHRLADLCLVSFDTRIT